MNRRSSSSGWRLVAAAALGVATLGVTLPAHANTYNVATTGDLVAAVNDANTVAGPHVINLAPGIYQPGSLSLNRDITINGAPLSPGSVIDGTVGGIRQRVFQVACTDGTEHVTLNDLTIQNGHTGIDVNGRGCGLLSVNRSTITGMTSIGMYLSGPAEITSSTLSGNYEAIEYEGNGPFATVNVTVAHNGQYGGVFYAGPEAAWTAVNTLFADNHRTTVAMDCNSGQPGVGDHNLDTSGTCGSLVTEVADAMIGPLSSNGGPTATVALMTGSPAIDTGTNVSCPATDQRGLSRPAGAVCDIGAFEYGAAPSGNTPTGSSVHVSPTDTTTGGTPVSLVFGTVTAAGNTTLTTSASGPPPPQGFSVGQPATYFEIATTAAYSGTIQVCIDTSGIVLPPNPQLLHFESGSGSWVPITVSYDSATHLICGTTSSLSPFAVMSDTEPPAITTPGTTSAEATAPGGAVVTYAVSATDNLDPRPTVACAPASGGLFPLGPTTVDCDAADASGNQATSSFSILVVDTTPPALAVPVGLTVPATSPAGAAVAFIATATDLVSGSLAAACVPASGSVFPIGSTMVTCVATDGAGNRSAPGTFAVVVTGIGDPIADLIALVQQLVPGPVGQRLVEELNDIQGDLAASRTAEACRDLRAFMHHVRALAHRTIAPANAARLIDAARQVSLAIGCGSDGEPCAGDGNDGRPGAPGR
jgi:hypothetical protein